MMKDLKKFSIPFVGLKEGNHAFEYQIDNTFFEAFKYEEFNNADVKISIAIEKKSTFLKLNFKAKGFVNVLCDVSLEPYNQKINTNLPLLVKYGEEFNDENEEVLILPYNAFEVDVSQYIYEMIVLAVPSRRVHPQVKDGTLETEATKKLKELEITEEKTADNADPRWDKLKNLITEKKK